MMESYTDATMYNNIEFKCYYLSTMNVNFVVLYVYVTFSDDKSTNVGIIIGAVMGGVIVVVVLTAMLLKLIFVARKKGKP